MGILGMAVGELSLVVNLRHRQLQKLPRLPSCLPSPAATIGPDKLFSETAQSSCAYDSHWDQDNPYENNAGSKSDATNWFVEPARQKWDRDAKFALARTEGDPSSDC